MYITRHEVQLREVFTNRFSGDIFVGSYRVNYLICSCLLCKEAVTNTIIISFHSSCAYSAIIAEVACACDGCSIFDGVVLDDKLQQQ